MLQNKIPSRIVIMLDILEGFHYEKISHNDELVALTFDFSKSFTSTEINVGITMGSITVLGSCQ